MSRPAIAICACAIAAAAILSPVTSQAGGGAGEFVTIASGEVGGNEWALAAKGRPGWRCFAVQTRDRVWTEATSTCEEADAFQGNWSHVFGVPVGAEENRLELELASPRVARLNLLLGHPVPGPNPPPTWNRVATHAMTRAQSAKAHLRRDFRFAVVTARRAFCVIKVRALGRDGRLLERLDVPCEY